MNGSFWRQVLASPILQFFVAGAVIFGIYAWFGDRASAPADSIVITLAEQRNIAALFERTLGRAPSADEMAELLEARVQDELYYREALALGLDTDDQVVRRRLAQKIEFIVDDLAARSSPADAELEAFLAANADHYRIEPSVSFRQIYLGDGSGAISPSEAAPMLLAALADGADPSGLGDPIALPGAMDRVPVSRVVDAFGQDFADAIVDAPSGNWIGPVASAYGAHLVMLIERDSGRAATLDEVRARVERDWRAAEREKARDAYVDLLKEKYAVTIEQPEAAAQ